MAPLLSVTTVSKSFGLSVLFSGISIALEEGERIAVIGRNGSGKSTLARILAKLEEPDDGEVSWRKGLRLSYVAQEDRFAPGSSAYDVLSAALSHDEPDRERRIGEVLGRIGFRDKTQSVDAMSGGEKKRLAIARGIITSPEVLILDEPTNHLDIVGVAWLENLISAASYSTIFISHDRYFIQSAAHRVVELDKRYPGGYFAVRGGYSEFLENRELFLEQLEQYRSSLANRVRREVEWLRQGAKARTTKQKARSDQARELVAELEGIARVDSRVGLEFGASNRKTRELIKIENVSKSIADRPLISSVSLILSPGSRLGVVGLNGSGKTTFLKLLLGTETPTSGRVIRASKLKIALLDQLRSGVSRTLTLQQVFCGDGDSVVFNGAEVHVAGWARRFLFRPEQLSIPLANLSGGEQARAIIARLMLEPADVLILDEPTNDLDIPTLEVLEEALIEFPGAVVLVTHDRYLLDRVCQVVLGLWGVGKSELFADHWQWARAVSESPANGTAKVDKVDTRTRSPQTKLSYMEQRELDSMENRILKLEEKVGTLQGELNTLDGADAKAVQDTYAALAENQKQLDRLYERWAELDAKQKELARSSGK